MGPRCNGSSPSTRCRRARRAPRPGCSGPGYLPASCQPPGAKPPVGLGTIWVQLNLDWLNARPGGPERCTIYWLRTQTAPALDLGSTRVADQKAAARRHLSRAPQRRLFLRAVAHPRPKRRRCEGPSHQRPFSLCPHPPTSTLHAHRRITHTAGAHGSSKSRKVQGKGSFFGLGVGWLAKSLGIGLGPFLLAQARPKTQARSGCTGAQHERRGALAQGAKATRCNASTALRIPITHHHAHASHLTRPGGGNWCCAPSHGLSITLNSNILQRKQKKPHARALQLTARRVQLVPARPRLSNQALTTKTNRSHSWARAAAVCAATARADSQALPACSLAKLSLAHQHKTNRSRPRRRTGIRPPPKRRGAASLAAALS